MSRITLEVPLIALLAVTTGCAQRPASLDQAQTALQSARSDPDVSAYAAAELDAAQAQLKSANDAWEQGEGQAAGMVITSLPTTTPLSESSCISRAA